MRTSNLFAASSLALASALYSFAALAQAPAAPAAPAPAAEAPAPDAKPAPQHSLKTAHPGHSGKLVATPAGDKAVEDLNDASLSSAKSGKPFVAPTTPAAAKETAYSEPKKATKKKAKAKAEKTEEAK